VRPARPAPALALLLAALPVLGAAAGRSADDPKPARRIDPPPAAADAERLGPGEKAVLRDPRTLVLEVRVGARDTYALLGQRYIVDLRELPRVRALNGESLPAPGSAVAIPYASLNDEYKVKVLRDLFPADASRDGDWVHRVGAGRLAAPEESLWQIALWFTGRGENFEALADRNDLPGLAPSGGQEIVLPGDLLLPPFARLARAAAGSAAGPADEGPPAAESEEEPSDDFTEAPGEEEPEPGPPGPGGVSPVPVAEGAEDLAYGRDAEGRFAAYRLKRGEALYSAVVVRYSGRLDAQEVNDLALAIARRSRIRDVTDIPIGFKVKIPLEHLLPEYLPRDDPRRLAWERSHSDVARYTNRSHTINLKDVAVILDAGHGGRDRGASHNGVWEHDYVYDILCRIKALLEQGTGARVLTTIKDRREGYTIQDTVRLKRSQAEVLLTDPPFPLHHRAASVNLRWYLSNSYYRRLVAEGYDPLKVVFTSLHADARHPSVGGAMVYVPGEEFRRGRYGHGGAVYARHREAREKPFVSFTREERKRAEGLSRQLAGALIGAFRDRGVAVHSYQPVRERIIRRGRAWVPAVLRCNEVPVEALIEVANLSNAADSRLIADPAYRQKVAEAYVQALQAYYGGRSPAPRPVSSRGR
jgi:N-acetylmuramoyl-L-alanine amidase